MPLLMKRLGFALLLLLVTGTVTLRADEITETVQRTLKEEGFYYGQINGEKTEDTQAAVRRYQIRNGLRVTGEINTETLHSLGIGSDAVRAAPQPSTTPDEKSKSNGENEPQSAEISPPSNPVPPGALKAPYPPPPEPNVIERDVFAGTPYEMAPPDLQRHVIVGAQTLLTRYGYYRSGIDGEFGAATTAALRTFQARAGLAPDGRLNMGTLGALGLLPGQHSPGFGPRRWRYFGRPVYRGEWIPDR
jgi:peptidoglycan hydrolase-like protein with peptidoglycan-binding domain